MSLTIKSIESSGAALAALCIAGVSSQAHAATVTIPTFIAFDSNVVTDIFIDSTTPQFAYDSYVVLDQKASFNAQNSGQIAASGINGTNAIDSSLMYNSNTTAKVSENGFLAGSGYVQLAFLNGNGDQGYGYASFDRFGDLVSITGDDINSITLETVTPLPSSWALFVGGMGFFGLLAQRRRRKLAV